MRYKEELSWILDPLEDRFSNDEETEQKKAFVRTLGLKPDVVGWARMDLSAPNADDILKKIEAFCKENHFRARAWYTMEILPDGESEWYWINKNHGADGFFQNNVNESDEKGEKVVLSEICAYKYGDLSPKGSRGMDMVTDHFRKVCLENGLSGLTFCWARDKGKYAAPQFFYIYPEQKIERFAAQKDISYYFLQSEQKEKRKLAYEAVKGKSECLERLVSVFYSLMIHLPDHLLRDELPEGGFADCLEDKRGFKHILVHRDTAKILLHEKAISEKDLIPALIFEEVSPLHRLFETKNRPKPTEAYIQKMQSEYEKLMAKERPIRMVTEKEALKKMRKCKKENKEFFGKKIGKAAAESLTETAYAPLLPYYLIADGAWLSDELELFSYKKALEEAVLFAAELEEENLSEKPDALLIGACADGDKILLAKDGKVFRFSHEEPVIIFEWPSLAQFIVEAIDENR